MAGDKKVKVIKDGDKILALIYSKKLRGKGVMFLTPKNYALQLGLHEYIKDRNIDLHRHPEIKRSVSSTEEMIYIEKGSAEIAITNDEWKEVARINLTKSDFALLVAGGHSLNIKKGTRMIEVKQGPYPGDQCAKIYKER